MQLHNLQIKNKKKKKKRVGRGGKRGTYSGKGMKGQKSRAGRKIRPEIRDVIKKFPKKRGSRVLRYRSKPIGINVQELEKKFSAGETVNPKSLIKKRMINKVKGKIPKVKLLGSGTLTKNLLVSECQISDGARKKLLKSGGKIL
ncbi:uL15 family ribosomal protein [Patescibacteria group bacterium]